MTKKKDTLQTIKDFLDPTYKGYPEIETRYGVPHPAELLMKVRDFFLTTVKSYNIDLTAALFHFVATSQTYQAAHKQNKEDKYENTYPPQTPVHRHSFSSRSPQTQTLTPLTESKSSVIQDNKKFYLYDFYMEETEKKALSEKKELKEIFQLNDLIHKEFPLIQKKIKILWQEYNQLIDCVEWLKSFLKNKQRCKPLENFDKFKLVTLSLKDKELTKSDQLKLVNLYLNLSQARAVLEYMAKKNKKSLSLEDFKASADPLNTCKLDDKLIDHLNIKLVELSENYEDKTAIQTYGSVKEYLAAIQPVMDNLSISSMEFSLLEERRRELLSLMEKFESVPLSLASNTNAVKDFSLIEIYNHVAQIQALISSHYLTPDQKEIREKISYNRQEFEKIQESLAKTVDPVLRASYQSQLKNFDDEYKKMSDDAKPKLGAEWKEASEVFRALNRVQVFSKNHFVPSAPSKNLSLLKIYEEWLMKMFLEVNSLKEIFPKLVDVAAIDMFDENENFQNENILHEDHQRSGKEGTLFTAKSRVMSSMVRTRKEQRKNIEVKFETVDTRLSQFLGISPAYENCNSFTDQWLCLIKMVKIITDKAVEAGLAIGNIKLELQLQGKTKSDAFVIRALTMPKTLTQLDVDNPHSLGRQLIRGLPSDRVNPLLEPIFNFIDANLQLCIIIDPMLEKVNELNLNDRGRGSIETSLVVLNQGLHHFLKGIVRVELAAQKLCIIMNEYNYSFNNQDKLLYTLLKNLYENIESFSAQTIKALINPTPPQSSTSLLDRVKKVSPELIKIGKKLGEEFIQFRKEMFESSPLPVDIKQTSTISIPASQPVLLECQAELVEINSNLDPEILPSVMEPESPKTEIKEVIPHIAEDDVPPMDVPDCEAPPMDPSPAKNSSTVKKVEVISEVKAVNTVQNGDLSEILQKAMNKRKLIIQSENNTDDPEEDFDEHNSNTENSPLLTQSMFAESSSSGCSSSTSSSTLGSRRSS